MYWQVTQLHMYAYPNTSALPTIATNILAKAIYFQLGPLIHTSPQQDNEVHPVATV